MLFYSTVAIVIGTLLGGIGLFYIIRKENGLKNLKKAKLSNPRLYINIISFVMLFIGVALIASGVLSFIYSHDLIFSIIFTALIALYLLIDFILQKKLKIKTLESHFWGDFFFNILKHKIMIIVRKPKK